MEIAHAILEARASYTELYSGARMEVSRLDGKCVPDAFGEISVGDKTALNLVGARRYLGQVFAGDQVLLAQIENWTAEDREVLSQQAILLEELGRQVPSILTQAAAWLSRPERWNTYAVFNSKIALRILAENKLTGAIPYVFGAPVHERLLVLWWPLRVLGKAEKRLEETILLWNRRWITQTMALEASPQEEG